MSWRRALLAAGLGTALLTGSPAQASEPLRIATGGVTGFYHSIGTSICRLLEPDLRTRVATCQVQSSAGSIANIRALETGTAELAIVQGDLIGQARDGTGAFAALGPQRRLRVLFSPGVESMAVVVRAGAPFTQVADLRGRRVDFGPEESGTRATALRLLRAVGIDASGFVQVTSRTSALSAAALCAGRSDAFAFMAAHPNSVVQEALATCPTRLLPLTEGGRAQVLARYPEYRATEIGPAVYPGLPASAASVGAPMFVVARDDLDEAVVRRVTSAVVDGLAELHRLHLAFAPLEKAMLAPPCPGAPYHAAARLTLRRAGIAMPACAG
jgi:TRAP transporter TAXI family solute receptor